MTGETVWVCEKEKCKKCGAFSAVGNGQWGIMKCGGKKGFKGSYVKIIAPSNYLQIAKAEIIGTSKFGLAQNDSIVKTMSNKSGPTKVGAISKAQK